MKGLSDLKPIDPDIGIPTKEDAGGNLNWDGFHITGGLWSSYFGPHWEGPNELKKKRGFYGRGGILFDIAKGVALGWSIRKVAREYRVSKLTVRRFRRFLVALNGPINCGCGLSSTHQGWCRVRFLESPDRQKFIRRWIQERRNRTQTAFRVDECRI